MFTGLIEAVGDVARLARAPGGWDLTVRTPLASELAAGASLAVNGVCLTVVAAASGEVMVQIGPETAKVTNLGSLAPGSLVNLERPVRADARMGGHFVLGHVDGVGRIEDLRPAGAFYWLRVRHPAAVAPLIVPKGSIAVDGISLTVAALEAETFDVQIIPFTWEHTNLQARRIGDHVNLECDVLGKYVLRALEARQAP